MTRWSKSSPPRCVCAVRGLHLEDALTELEDRDVERAAAEVVHGDDFVLLLVESIRERCGGRFVDDPQDLETGDLTASFVAWRCWSSKYAGTVMTAWVTFSPRYASASVFSF